MTNPSILHVVTDRDRRGAQVHAIELSRGLAACGAVSEVLALAPGQHGDLLDVDTLGPSRRSRRTFVELRRRAVGFDVVVAHGSATLFACSVALAGTGVPFVYRQISDPLFWAGTWSRRLRVAALIRRTAAIVALADDVAGVVADHYWLRRDRIVTIPNAVESGPWSPPTPEQRSVARTDLGLDESDFVMVYLGALAPEKGVDIAVRAASTSTNTRLVVAGDGSERTELERLADEIAPGQVRFIGPSETPRDVLHAGDVLVLPSRGGDSMPAVLIEAGLCGLPAVTTPVGSIEAVVRHGVTGLVVPIGAATEFASAVAALRSRPGERERLGHGALARCQANFTIEAVVPRWLEMLDQVLAAR